MKKTNGVMMQYFEWYLPENCKLWKQLSKNAAELNKKGFTAL
jgi:alpha-amylase